MKAAQILSKYREKNEKKKNAQDSKHFFLNFIFTYVK